MPPPPPPAAAVEDDDDVLLLLLFDVGVDVFVVLLALPPLYTS